MLLRNRSKAVTKPSLMADHSSQPSPNQNYATIIQSFFVSPKFKNFTTKCLLGNEVLRSPTSILDSMALPPFRIPFLYHRGQVITPQNFSEKKSLWDKMDSKGIGLALVDELQDERIEENSAQPSNGNVLFGTQLKVKIPPPPLFTFNPFESQTSSGDFGIKTQDSLVSPSESQNSGIYTGDASRVVATGVVSLSEMELSEEYTCVISHGPNPRTTHIFDNCIVKSHCPLPFNSHSASTNFLNFCHTCKKHLEQTEDIFIYRGEKAFCSRECRYQEMMVDGADNSEFDSYGHS